MSRAYRISVSESLRRVIKGSDHVTSQLEILAVVPPEELSQILADELAQRGFEKQADGKWRREEEGVAVVVDAATAEVEVRAEISQSVALQSNLTGHYYDESSEVQRKRIQDKLREDAREDLEAQAEQRAAELERQATDALERKLRDLQPELDQIVNRVTAEGLKRKASRLGQIKELTEDPASGSLTIVVEV